LEGDARKSVVIAYQERKQEQLQHPLLTESVPMGLLPLIQARLLARAIRQEADCYLPSVVSQR
jgi:CRISP-associated protein Cas1